MKFKSTYSTQVHRFLFYRFFPFQNATLLQWITARRQCSAR